MRRGALTVLACAIAVPLPFATAMAQSRAPAGRTDDSRTSQSHPFGRLFEERSRLIVQPMGALLGDGTFERRLNARVTWPAEDSAPDFAVHLLAGLTSGQYAYSRSGLGIDIASGLGPARFTSAATLSAGGGGGPRQALSFSFGAGFAALWLEVQTSWLKGGSYKSSLRRVGDESISDLPRSTDVDAGNYTDGELKALQRVGAITLRLTGGQRFGGDARKTGRWLYGEADLPMPILRRFDIVLAGGVRPDRADLGQPGGRFAQLGLRMEIRAAGSSEPVPAPAPVLETTLAVPIDRDRYLIRLHLPGARQVELKGDITDWRVVPLYRAALDDLWETTIHKPAGIYHVNIRVDGGEWIVPPGLVALPDRFGGSTGVLFLPPNEEADHEC